MLMSFLKILPFSFEIALLTTKAFSHRIQIQLPSTLPVTLCISGLVDAFVNSGKKECLDKLALVLRREEFL